MRLTGQRISRIPLRRRLIAGFAATMFVLLTAAGTFVYWRVQYALDRNLNNSLRDAAASLAPLVTASGQLPVDSATLARVNGFQVLTAEGRVVDHDARLGERAALDPTAVRRALVEPVHQDTGKLLLDTNHPLRLYAVPVHVGSSVSMVLVVAIDRQQRDEALRELLAQLTAAGLTTLVLTSLVGDLLARAALRPVETYRSRAADIAGGATDLRLEVPKGRDDEITRLGHTLNAMLDALNQALHRERRFLNDASHELRTPLTRMSSRVQLTQRRTRTLAEHERALEEISSDLGGLTALADDLLELGTTEQNSPPTGPHDLAAVARKVVSTRTSLAPSGSPYAAAGSLTVEAIGRVDVDVDPVTLGRLLDNLLDNAEVHGAPPVLVSVSVEQGWGHVTVVDYGQGMPPALLASAADRFARSPEARNRPGSGLGLSLVASIVTSAGGQLRLCYAGRHHQIGTPTPWICEHGQEMTITAVLPVSTGSPRDV